MLGSAIDNLTFFVREYFTTKRVYIPATGGQASWVKIEECVWDGPQWLTAKHKLKSIPKYSDFEFLFRTVLQVCDAGYPDFFAELENLRKQQAGDIEHARAVYEHLWKDFERDLFAPAQKYDCVRYDKGVYNMSRHCTC